MAKIGKISPIKRKFETEAGSTISSALSQHGRTRIPGTKRGITPYREKNGEYRTGLDPEAIYIARMTQEEAAQERIRVKELRDELERLTGLDLSPRSDYYSKMFSNPDEAEARAVYVKLDDTQNIFNLDDPQDAITYAWLRVHPDIAPSFNAWSTGQSSYRCPHISSCQFFVDDVDFEAEMKFTKTQQINKAIELLQLMSPERQYKVAKLLTLPIGAGARPSLVYNALDEYIKETNVRGKRDTNVKTFTDIAQMADANLEVRFKIKEALDYQVYRREKLGKIMEGTITIADNEEELVTLLTSKKGQEDYLALIKKVENAKIVSI